MTDMAIPRPSMSRCSRRISRKSAVGVNKKDLHIHQIAEPFVRENQDAFHHDHRLRVHVACLGEPAVRLEIIDWDLNGAAPA